MTMPWAEFDQLDQLAPFAAAARGAIAPDRNEAVTREEVDLLHAHQRCLQLLSDPLFDPRCFEHTAQRDALRAACALYRQAWNALVATE